MLNKFFNASNGLLKTITHLTDVEGNWRYFNHWINDSRHITWDNQQLAFRSLSRHTSHFVYGGDYGDKGPGDLRIGKALNDFKCNFPDKVSLIAGNRDAKCQRFTYELEASKIKTRLLSGALAWWQKEKISPKDYAIKFMLEKKYLSQSYQDVAMYIDKLSEKQCQTIYLQWMLNETMGCAATMGKPGTFEYRRRELAQISKQELHTISDEDVTDSFLESVSPNGEITRYLKQAELGVIHEDTLFIHGAVTLENMGYVPGLNKDTGYRVIDAKEWIEHLNAWYKSQIKTWIENPVTPGQELSQPGIHPLDHYLIFNPRSIVTTNWYHQNTLMPISPQVIEYLNKAGIYRVVSGHQPFSDFPLIIRTNLSKSKMLEVIVGDTGYSDPTACEDNRGAAIHHLDILQTDHLTCAEIKATRVNHAYSHLILPSPKKIGADNDIPIGHFTQDGRLIRMGANGELVSSQLNGFSVIDVPIDNPRKGYKP